MSGRVALPDRRPSITETRVFKGTRLAVTIGFDPVTGAAREVFANARRQGADVPVLEGSDMQAVLADACVLISIALQYGVGPAALAKSLGRVPDPARGEEATDHASVIGVIVGCLLDAGRDDAGVAVGGAPVPVQTGGAQAGGTQAGALG